jgi:GT2 family glycosyltransferase
MFSIIIPCRTTQEAQSCLEACKRLKRKDIEVICLPDSETGPISPGAKRNIGILRAKGDIVAFIDSDAYPDPFWLNYVVKDAAGWCGPGLLPPNSPFGERVTDLILKFMPFNYRVTPKKTRYVNDYPTFNLILRKDIINLVGGFKEDTLTGEDSDICQRICGLGMKIVYIPQCIVYHKRRSILLPFLRQTATYAMHRGIFFRKGKGNSRKLVYCLPSLCLILLLYFVIRWLF